MMMGAGEGEDADAQVGQRGDGLIERMEGASRGTYVINEEDMAMGEQFGTHETEYSLGVLLSLIGAELCLTLGETGASDG